MKIAVVGTGIAGLSAAWLLRRHAEVTVYEQNAYAGGHTHTFQVPEGPAVDTGFIVFNERNYPHLSALFRHLGVGSQESEMSFAASIDGGRVEYAGDNLNTLFAQRWNILDRAHWRMLRDIVRFNSDAKRALSAGLAPELTLGDFILSGGYGDELSRRYLLPMAAAIWSCPVGAMLRFPAASFLQFFENHGLLDLLDRPRWRTVTGGSREYVKKLLVSLGDRVRLDTPVTGLRRVGASVRVWDSSGAYADYDRVVMAVHADQVLPLLAAASSAERRIFSAFKYQANRVVLHSDAEFMPKRRKAWAAWNYLAGDAVDGKARVSVTYWMNRLQRLSGDTDYFVSLNPLTEPKGILYQTVYAHPVFTREAIQAQRELAAIQGQDRIWFCGAWTGYGFHEDGLRSAVEVAQSMGCAAPWLEQPAPAPEQRSYWVPLPEQA
ncbi:MAG TPA: FAD-dependent oxidoreductase [Gammaproteobacteria bacterium]|jgi:predicted NAD/FAD-binding protein